MRTTNSIGNRLIALALSIVMVLGMFPTGVWAAGEGSYGTVTALSEGIIITTDGAEVTATYKGTLNWEAADPSVGRFDDGWWAGIKVTAPEGMNLEKAQYNNGAGTDAKSFNQNKDSADDAEEQYIGLWGLTKPEFLRSANLTDGLSTYTWQFDWDGNGEFEQTVILNFDADQITLLKDGVQKYPASATEFGTLEVISPEATVSGTGADITAVFDQKAVIDWVAANPGVGRNQDGWWVGVKINAPAHMTMVDLENVQYKSGGVVKSFWSSRDSGNSEANHYMQMWIAVNGLYTNGSVNPYTYEFDWNNDGIFEQTVTLKVDPDALTLKKDGLQVYPELGEVTSYSGGTVTGSKTDKTEVLIQNVNLNWSEADPSTGRTRGWWVGIKVQAPLKLTDDVLENAKYQVKSGPTADWSVDKSFWDNQDSNKTDATHNIQLWMCLTPAIIEKFKAENRHVALFYRFDWNGDGEFEQTIDFMVDPNGNIVLNKVDQSGFAFETTSPENIWAGEESFTNKASGGQGDGDITYEIISGKQFADVDANGTLTNLEEGVITVRATKAADSEGYYNAVTAEYTITVVKNEQNPSFEKANPGAITYIPGLTFQNEVQNYQGKVTYAITAGADVATIDPSTGMLNIKKAGQVTVKATIAGNNNYKGTTLEYALTVNKADQTDFAFLNAPTELVWVADVQNALTLVNGKGKGEVVWTITDGADVATIDPEGKITLLKAGRFTVQAQKAGDDCYNQSAAITTTIVVNKAEQNGFEFNAATATVTYNDNGNVFNTVTVSGGQSGGDITYVSSDPTVADVDANGVVTLKKAGTVTITATKAADDCHNATTAAYTLTINKDNQEFGFEKTGEALEVFYGIKSFSNAVRFDDNHSASSSLTYALSDNNLGASIDPETGIITFADSEGKVGELTITANKEGDECYNAYTASYTLKVSYLTVATAPYASGSSLNDSGWFTGDVVINAPTGYTISYNNELLTTTDWAESVPYDTEGANGSAQVYLKDVNGYISDAITVAGIHIDTVNPSDLSITYATPTWEVMKETLSFGLYQSKELSVTLSAKDINSGIAKLVYNIGGEDVVISADQLTKKADGVVEYTFSIPAQYRNKVVLTATDISGRSSKLEDNRILVLDTTNPGIEVGYRYASKICREEGGIHYTQDDVTITFTIDESNFDLSGLEIIKENGQPVTGKTTGVPVVTINGEEKSVTWTQKDALTTEWEATLTLNGDGDYVVGVTFTDPANNVMAPFSQEIHIDSNKPVIDLEYTLDEVLNDNNYKADRNATITIAEHNFKAEKVELIVVAEDIMRTGVSVMDYAKYAADPNNWTTEGDVHTLELPFTVDARYDIKVNYTDLAGNEADEVTDMFILDKTKPANIRFEYSQPARVLEILTLGLYQADVVVTVIAEDITSGVDYFELTYTKTNGASDINLDSFEVKLPATKDKDDDAKTFRASYTLPADADGSLTVKVTDKAGNATETISNDKRIVVDDTNPELTVKYIFDSGSHNDEDGIYYTQKGLSVYFTFLDANFGLGLGNDVNVAPVITVNGVNQTMEWNPTDKADEWVGILKLVEDGDYQIEATYEDPSTNQMNAVYEDPSTGETVKVESAENEEKVVYKQEVRIDANAPVIDVVYDNNDVKNENNYKLPRTATIKMREHNFQPEDMVVTVTAVNILGEPIEVENYAQTITTASNWRTSDDEAYELDVDFDIDAIYTIHITYTDPSGRDLEKDYSAEFVVDGTPSDNIQITYTTPVAERIIQALTFGFYQADMVVSISADDITSGVDYIELTYTRDPDASDAHTDDFMETLQVEQNGKTFTTSYTLSAQARGSFSAKVFDMAGNEATETDVQNMIVADTTPPGVSVEFESDDTDPVYRNEDFETLDAVDNASHVFYTSGVSATITINESNFFEGQTGESSNDIVHKLMIKATKTDNEGNETVIEYLPNGADQLADDADQTQNITWSTSGDTHTATIEFEDDADYVLEIEFVDYSENPSEIEDNFGVTGSEEGIYASKTIVVDTTAPVIEISYDNDTANNETYYNTTRTATIEVTEHNFRAEEFVATITAVDVLGDTVSTTDFADFAADASNWSSNGNVHTLELEFSDDATYEMDLEYADMAGNEADDFEAQSFTVDQTAATNIQITYSTSVFEKIIETLTFGFYQAEAVVTVTAEDITSGVDYMELTYTRDPDATDVHTADFMETLEPTQNTSSSTFTCEYSLSAEARGSFSVVVYDMAGNDASATDETNMIVADTVTPEMEISYAPKNEEAVIHFVDSEIKDVATFAEATQVYYDGDVVVTLTVNEANFFEGQVAGENDTDVVHEITIKVTRTDDDGNTTVTEYLPNGAEQLVSGAATAEIVWATEGDTHTASIEFTEDGDYVLEVTYADFSENQSLITGNDGFSGTHTYTSKIITVDETAPVIHVEYQNTDVVNTIDEREYFAQTQSAIISVTEHNFRASEIAAVVTAKDFLGADVAVADFAAQLADEKNWIHEGNVHTAKVDYVVDANYTFDVDYQDLASNASVDYAMDQFTVDVSAPTDLNVSYSTNVFQEVLESITFGYYNATMTVTISAVDKTTGIHHFEYSYINSKNVSDRNAELLNQAIQAAEITHRNGVAVASFQIPKMVVVYDNQFNGTVNFTAFDRSENSTELKDTTRIVVDNISPTANITYNPPAQSANDISYYDGNIQGTITINESNFDSSDVTFSVTKDGVNYPANVAWFDQSVDTHVGNFTLTEEGDYIVYVQYGDKSGNQMANYVSNRLTLDTTTPTIRVSNIKANSANKDEKFGFVIELNDINLDVATMKPVLTAVVKNEKGLYETVEIDIGEPTEVIAGETYTYAVENLEIDALYTISCQTQDMSGNAMSQIVLEDGNSYDEVQFSVNRNGSTFGFGDDYISALVQNYYIHSVDQDLVIFEVNVDPIENYKVTLNGKNLTEGDDYTTEQSSNPGEWSKRTYFINKELFADEGEYNLIVSSVDKTNTTSYSDIKNLAIAFVVDQSKPVITISGLESGGRYQTDVQTVTLIPTDEGGRLNELTVRVLDSKGSPVVDENGNDISLRFTMSGEELLKHLEDNDGKVTFTIPSGLNNKVQIICTDCAVNAENLPNEYNEIFEKVTVSENQLVIFYANSPLFYGSIGGVSGLIALIAFLLKRKKATKAVKA